MSSETKEKKEKGRSKSPMDLKWNDEELKRYVTSACQNILPRKVTGLTAQQQRHITKQIKRARNMLLLK